MTGTKSELREKVLRALTDVAPELLETDIKDEALIRESYDLDSADYLHFIVRLHELLAVDIPEKDYPKISTVGSAVNYLADRQNEPTPSQRRN